VDPHTTDDDVRHPRASAFLDSVFIRRLFAIGYIKLVNVRPN